MTSKLTRERIQRIMRAINSEAYDEEEIREWLSSDEIMELSRMALAAMDGEPVAYMTYKGYLLHAGDPKLAEYSEPMPLYADPRPEPISAEPVAWLLSGGGAKNVVVFDSGNAYADPLREVTPLYRHAQPVPVVPYDFDFDRFNDVVWLECVASNPHMHSPTTSIIARVALELNKRILAGNSPVITDGWKMVPIDATRAMIDAARRVEEDGYDAMHKAMLATAPQSPGIEPASVLGKWIPVSERIPDNTEPVLCIEKRADFGTYGQPFVCWHDGGGWVGKTNYRPIVTHWMPLPADPQEVK